MILSNSKRMRIFLLIAAACCGFIWSFTNLSYDGEYQLAMAYRMIHGDRLFIEMWEPHQTSAFLPAALMWIYVNILHTTTGIVVYMQICGILIRAAVAYFIYRTVRNDTDETVAFGMALLFFMLSPKDYALPDFSNQQLWYGTLFFCCLWNAIRSGKGYFMVLGALSLCMEVLAYPSHLIGFPGALIILWCYSGHRRRDIAILTGICAALGLGFCVAFLPEWKVFLRCMDGMLALEPTHMISAAKKVLFYLKGTFELSLMIAGITILGYFAGVLIHAVRKEEKAHKYTLWLFGCIIVVLVGFFINILSADHRNAYSGVFLFLVGLGIGGRKFLNGKERQLYICGSTIGLLSFIATLILTDLSVADSVVYGLMAIICALIPLGKQIKEMAAEYVRKGIYCCCVGFVFLLVLRCFYIRTPLTGRGQICSSLSDMSIVRSGPAMGLISDEQGVCMQRDSYLEWKELISKGDKVWIVGCILDTLGYLYEDVEVAAPSTMSIPTYNSAVLDYWRLNPDKYPDVIVVEGYLGEIVYELKENEWFMTWLRDEYKAEYVEEGTYWIYYFREKSGKVE